MQLISNLATLLALTATTTNAHAISKRQSQHIPSRYYGISLNINMAKKGEQPVYGRAPVELNKLAPYTVNASEILFDQGAAVGVDVKSVACQVFSDADGTKPIGQVFDAEEPLELAAEGQDLVMIGSLICFVSGDLVGN